MIPSHAEICLKKYRREKLSIVSIFYMCVCVWVNVCACVNVCLIMFALFLPYNFLQIIYNNTHFVSNDIMNNLLILFWNILTYKLRFYILIDCCLSEEELRNIKII